MSNWALVYFFIWSIRIKGWGFGMGYLFGGLGKLVSLCQKPFQKKQKDGDDASAEQAEESTANAEKPDVKPDASEAKAQKANDATGEEGAHTMGGV